MSVPRINLQSTPTPASVTTEKMTFTRSGIRLRGMLFRPTRATTPLPGVVVAGAWTSIKEQMAGTYARELAVRGFATLAFDSTGWGESEGNPRYVEDPETKTVDIVAAVDFLATRADIDASRIFGLGICASAGYMATAAADSSRLVGLALVAPWLHDPAMAERIYGGPEAVAALLTAGEGMLTAASTTDAEAVMYQAPYYTEAVRLRAASAQAVADGGFRVDGTASRRGGLRRPHPRSPDEALARRRCDAVRFLRSWRRRSHRLRCGCQSFQPMNANAVAQRCCEAIGDST